MSRFSGSGTVHDFEIADGDSAAVVHGAVGGAGGVGAGGDGDCGGVFGGRAGAVWDVSGVGAVLVTGLPLVGGGVVVDAWRGRWRQPSGKPFAAWREMNAGILRVDGDY